MNVTWSTDYDRVTLWLIYDGQYNNPTLLISGSSEESYLWTVDDDGNNTRPFSFRAVDTDGTLEAQRGGGFYSGQFWIEDSSNPGRSSSATTTTTPAASLPGSSTVALSPPALGSDSKGTTSPSTSSSSSSGSSSSSNGTAIGVGIGVGVGVALLVIAAFAFWYFRRKKSRQPEAPRALSDAHMSYAPSDATYTASPGLYHSGMKSPQPSEMAGYQEAAEAPNMQEPRELEADTSGAQLAGSTARGENKPPAVYQ